MSLFVEIKKNWGAFTLDVALEAGDEVLGLLGASGSGKSMTLRCIAGIVTPDSGKIVLNGRTLFDSAAKINLPPRRRNVGLMFQNYALFPQMTVAQNIVSGVREKGARAAQLCRCVELLRLEGLEERYPRQLSGGQQQRVALARMLASQPEILMLDEPFSALDGQLRGEIEQEFTAALSDFKGTVAYVSHSIGEVYQYCRKTAVISGGRVMETNTTRELFADPKKAGTARLLCCKNIAAAERDGERIFVPAWNAVLRAPKTAREFTQVGIYGEDVELAPGPGENCLSASILHIRQQPRHVAARVLPEGANETLSVAFSEENVAELTPGVRVFLRLPPEKLLLLKE